MRKKILEELIREIYGPRAGADEEISGNPYREYLTGVIVPKTFFDEENDPDSEISTDKGENATADDDNYDDDVSFFPSSNLDPRFKAKSFGISFIVKADIPAFRICVTWGRYSFQTRDGTGFWKRRPNKKIMKIFLERDRSVINEQIDEGIRLQIIRIPSGNFNQIYVTLINEISSNSEPIDEIAKYTLFQPSIRIKMDEGNEIIQASTDSFSSTLEFVLRKRGPLARGHMCSAIWKEIDYVQHLDKEVLWADGTYFGDCEEFFESDVRSEFVPLYADSSPIFDLEKKLDHQPELAAYKLSESWHPEEIEKNLKPLVDAYRKWVEGNERDMADSNGDERKLLEEILRNQKILEKRLMDGIELLKKDEDARLAFCFANRTIWLQNSWKEVPSDFRWRPFQLAFIIMTLNSLTNREDEYRDYLDLLWIPTGGGKTETYLALMIFIIILRRRKDKIRGSGTAAISRYTLRLLTVQQFRRTLNAITAAEYLRVKKFRNGRGWKPEECDLKEDLPYGSIRFSVGMWVGGSVSPNHLRTDLGAIDALTGKKAEGEPAQVVRCPACHTYVSVPKSGMPAHEKLYLTIESQEKATDLERRISGHSYEVDTLRVEKVIDHGTIKTVVIRVGDRKVTEEEIKNYWSGIDIQGSLLPLSVIRPGYFGCREEPGRRKENKYRDFEIYCPNPDCKLNRDVEYLEGVPRDIDGSIEDMLSDGLYLRTNEFSFGKSRIPIPAYTVDEQIYSRCPSVIVSTADKFARLAFEPRASSIFGNVEKYNAFYGYYRDDLLPQNPTKEGKSNDNTVSVKGFLPPDLIIQDELHLLEGPLGSMFGLYEVAVEALLKEKDMRPKYIASTATIKEAEKQVNDIFARKLYQFPPNGFSYEDNFFVHFPEKEEAWNEERPGRVYAGVYSPGMGENSQNML